MPEILTDKEWLVKLASLLDGECAVFEEPDGARWIRLSEEFAQMIAARLRGIARGEPEAEADHGG